jgi:hypothetical protein
MIENWEINHQMQMARKNRLIELLSSFSFPCVVVCDSQYFLFFSPLQLTAFHPPLLRILRPFVFPLSFLQVSASHFDSPPTFHAFFPH